jgi:hypothetical protein
MTDDDGKGGVVVLAAHAIAEMGWISVCTGEIALGKAEGE